MTDHWPHVGGGAGHSGHRVENTRPRWPFEVLWRHDFDDRVAWEAPVVDDEGRAFVQVKMTQIEAATFRAISPEGRLVWGLRTGRGWGPGGPPPAIDGDRVLLPETPESWVVNRSTGECRRKIELPWGFSGHPLPVVVDGIVYTDFQAVDFETGDQYWGVDLDEPVYRLVADGEVRSKSVGPQGDCPAVVDGTVFVSGQLWEGEYTHDPESDDPPPEPETWGHVHAIDATDGSIVWATEFETRVSFSTPTVVAGDDCLVVDMDDRLRTFDRATGEAGWTAQIETGSIAGRRPAVASDLVVVCAGDRVIALDRATGRERWCVPLDDEVAGPPAIVEGTVHASDAAGGCYGIDLDGTMRWTLQVEERLRTGPVVAQGRLFVAGEGLFCLGSA